MDKVIQIKSYSKDNKIIFILEVPTVEIESYNYYHLYSFQIKHGNNFKTIIPQSKYLIQNERKYALFNEHCKEMRNN